jgi:hypothetical protein
MGCSLTISHVPGEAVACGCELSSQAYRYEWPRAVVSTTVGSNTGVTLRQVGQPLEGEGLHDGTAIFQVTVQRRYRKFPFRCVQRKPWNHDRQMPAQFLFGGLGHQTQQFFLVRCEQLGMLARDFLGTRPQRAFVSEDRRTTVLQSIWGTVLEFLATMAATWSARPIVRRSPPRRSKRTSVRRIERTQGQHHIPTGSTLDGLTLGGAEVKLR